MYESELKQISCYEYNENILLEVLKYKFEPINILDDGSGDAVDKFTAKEVLEEIQDDLYIIAPDPMNPNLKFLVFELENSATYFYYIDDSREVQRNLRQQYKQFNKGFRKFYSFKYFMKQMDFYKERKLGSHNILLADGYIYNCEELCFKKQCKKLPFNISDLKFKPLNDNTNKILEKGFNLMYPDVKDLEKFLYYILCNLNKSYVHQKIFLIFDVSGVGKTAKIIPMVELGLNIICDSRLLEKSELYNLASQNNVIYNETQTENINGSTLSNLADKAPLTVSRKGDSSLTIRDKPIVQVIGETAPFFKSLNDGTNRRFLLVPRVDNKFINYDKSFKKEFYNIVYDNPIETIQFYIQMIKKHILNKEPTNPDYKDVDYNNEDKHIFKSKIDKIQESMNISLRELEQLTESKEYILERYFNMIPLGKYDECNQQRYLIEGGKSLDLFLEYIDNEIITVSHFNNSNLRKKYLRGLIKENINRNVKDLGLHNIGGKNYFYYYSLTLEGKKLVDYINKENIFNESIAYITK